MSIFNQSLSFSTLIIFPMVSFPTRHWALFEHSGGHLLSAVVQAVVAQKEACIDGLGQQGIDGNHDEEHGQLEDRVESEENRTGHHGQHPREDEVLETEKGAGQIQQECGLVTLLVIDSSRSPYTDVCWASPFGGLRPSSNSTGPKLNSSFPYHWESQFLGRLIRSPESPRRKKGSRALKEEVGVWGSQGGEKDKFFFFKPRADDCTTKQLILLKDMFSLKLCINDYMTTMYPAWGHVSP